MSNQDETGRNQLNEGSADECVTEFYGEDQIDRVEESLNTRFSDQEELAEELKQLGKEPLEVSIRELLAAFNMKRRGRNNVEQIQKFLKRYGAELPDGWNTEDYYGNVEIRNSNAPLSRRDVNFRYPLSSLKPDDSPLTKVSGRTPSTKVITTMLENDFSQIPVVDVENNTEILRGSVTWRSIVAALGRQSVKSIAEFTAEELMEEPGSRLRSRDDLLTVAPRIISEDYVYFDDSNGRLVGIATVSDLATAFFDSAGIFLRLAEPEQHLKFLIDQKLDIEDYRNKAPGYERSRINSASNLSLGTIREILDDDALFVALGLTGIDKDALVDLVEKMRVARNEVMHFNSDNNEEKRSEVVATIQSILTLLRFGDPHLYEE